MSGHIEGYAGYERSHLQPRGPPADRFDGPGTPLQAKPRHPWDPNRTIQFIAYAHERTRIRIGDLARGARVNPRAVRGGVRLSGPRQLPVRTHTEIVEELAATSHPDVARDPDESLAVLERLIREARAAVKAARRRGGSTTSFRRPV